MLASCSKREATPVNSRVAIVEFDNQSVAGDSWVGRELAMVMSDALKGRKELAPTLVQDAEGWRTLGVGRYVSGNYHREKQGLRVRGQLVDVASSRVLAQVDELVSESKLAEFAVARLAAGLIGGEVAGGVRDEVIWKELAVALEEPGTVKLGGFVAAHREFEPAYPLLAERLVRQGKREDAEALRGALKSDSLYAAQLGVVLAGQGPDRLKAIERLAAFRPEDPLLLVEMGTRAGAAGDWALAAKQYQVLTRLEPNQVDWWNRLGYAEANQNHLPEAVVALNEYRRLAPGDANTLDSLGEVHYMNRKFTEAAKYFDEQSRLFPAFQNGVGWRKAAFAYYFAGDVKTADLRFDDWVKRVLGGAAPSMQAFQRAMWLARTQRAAAAMALLNQEIATSSGERKMVGEMHLAMLQFGLEGKRPSPAQLQAWNGGIRDANARNAFSVFALLAQPAPNVETLRARIEASLPQPQLAVLKNELLAAAGGLFEPVQESKPKVFPVPIALETPVEALLLRSRLAVLP
jgi:tetratricopeptide (TPR) repeat protein